MAAILIGLTACTRRESDSNAREVKEDSDSAARQAGKAATSRRGDEEATAKVGKELKKAGKEVKERMGRR